MDQGIVVEEVKYLFIVVCSISVTVDIMLLVMSTEHVILVGIGLGVLQSVSEVIASLNALPHHPPSSDGYKVLVYK